MRSLFTGPNALTMHAIAIALILTALILTIWLLVRTLQFSSSTHIQYACLPDFLQKEALTIAYKFFIHPSMSCDRTVQILEERFPYHDKIKLFYSHPEKIPCYFLVGVIISESEEPYFQSESDKCLFGFNIFSISLKSEKFIWRSINDNIFDEMIYAFSQWTSLEDFGKKVVNEYSLPKFIEVKSVKRKQRYTICCVHTNPSFDVGEWKRIQDDKESAISSSGSESEHNVGVADE